MALTRAQLLSGNSSQGTVLPGQVQAVSQGAGVTIASNGQISVDAATTTGLVKLNNPTAYNAYVWPNVDGAADQFLQTDGAGNLTWSDATGFAVVTVSSAEPAPADEGELWYDCTVGALKIYQTCTAPGGWTLVSESGLLVDPASTAANPAFLSGAGTAASPYICEAGVVSTGGSIFVSQVSISGLAPFQTVPIVDLNAVTNGGRFTFSNSIANAAGVLFFDIIFTDLPASPVGTTYTAAVKVGSNSVYINASVTSAATLVLTSPGNISGSTDINSTLTYTLGTASGGVAPYTYTWVWRLASDQSILQTNGLTYVTNSAQFTDSIYVELTATDASGQRVSNNTAFFGPLTKPPFPNPTQPVIPPDIGEDGTFIWDGPATTLSSDSCLLFKVGTGSFSQGPTSVTSGQLVTTTWDTSAAGLCGNAPNGTTIEGCIYDSEYSTCASLVIDRIPSPFSFNAQTGANVSTQVTSNTVNLTGFNAPAYVTLNTTNATSVQGSVDGGSSWANIPLSGETFPVSPGQSLTVRLTTGSVSETTYSASFKIGQGSTILSPLPTFSVETGGAPFPTTVINFPTTTTTTGLSTWQDGTVTLSSGGCIEISTDGTSFVTSGLSISNGQSLFTRWKSGTGCGGEVTGVTISGTVTGGGYTTPGSLTIDRRPNSFTFTAVSDVPPETQQESPSVVTFTSINAPTYITYTPGLNPGTSVQGSTNGSTWAAIPTSGTSFAVNPGGSLWIRMTAGSSYTATYSVTINAGDSTGVTSTSFDIVTGSPGFPVTHIVFPTTTAGTGSVGITSNWQNGPQTLNGTGCIEVSTDGESFGTVGVSNGDTVYTRWIPSSLCGNAPDGTAITGGVSDGSTTEQTNLTISQVPDANSFSFPLLGKQFPSTTVFSATATPTGINSVSYVTVASGGTIQDLKASIGGTAFVTVPPSGDTSLPILPGQSIQLRGVTEAGYGQTTESTIEIGIPGDVVTANWRIVTALTGVTTPSITAPTNGSVDIDPYVLLPGQVVLTSTPYATVGVPDPHQASDWQVYANTYPITSSEITTAAIQVTDTWSLSSNPFTSNIFAIAAGGGVVVAGGTGGQAAISVDEGTTWSLITTPFTANNINAIEYSKRYGFMMGGDGGQAAFSNSGESNSWISVNVGFGSSPVRDFTWQGGDSIVDTTGTWVAVGDNGRISTSPTGDVWTGRTSNFGTSAVLGVAYGAGVFVAVGEGGTIATSSDNGVTWVIQTSGITNDLTTVSFGEGNFIAAGAGGAALISSDGLTWTTKDISFGTTRVNKVTYGGGQFVAVGSTGRTSVSSDGGLTWSLRLSGFGGTDTAYTIVYNNNVDTYNWLAGGNNGKLPRIGWVGPASRLTLASGATDGFALGDVVEGSGGAVGYIATVSDTEMTVVPYSPLWSSAQTVSTSASYATLVVDSGNDSSNLEQYAVEPPLLEWYTPYYVRVRYKAFGAAVYSDWSPWSSFQLQATPGWGTLNITTDATVFEVPPGVGTLTVTSSGASSSGLGASAVATFDVQAGDTFRMTTHTGGAGTPQGGSAGGPAVSFGPDTGSPNTTTNIWLIGGGGGGYGRYNPSGDPTQYPAGSPGRTTGGGTGSLNGEPGFGDNDPGGNPNQPFGGGGGGAGWTGGGGGDNGRAAGGGGSVIVIPANNNPRDETITATYSGGARVNIKWI